jgi:serine/threonine protein kinase
MNTVKNDLETVEAATTSTELFGSATTDSESRRQAKRQFHCLVAAIHPDRAQASDVARYAAATTRLNELYRSWVAEAEAVQSSATYVGDNDEYVLGDVLARGSVATLYRAQDRSGASVVVKIPRSRRANPLMETERSALTDIRGAPYVPTLVDRISAADPASGEVRRINVLDDLSTGFVTLADVRRAYPNGLDPRDWAWMHRRLLRALAAAHQADWVHTAIVEENVLIQPELHGLVLVGWSFATRSGMRPAAKISSCRSAYPPELGEAASPGWDIYMAHQLMTTMLGDRIPSRMKTFALGCMQDNPRLRPDATDLLGEFDELLELLYGERTFRAFTVRPI